MLRAKGIDRKQESVVINRSKVS